MAETPRSQELASDTPPEGPHPRHSSALAHDAPAASRGKPRRSIGRPSQTPRDVRPGDRHSRPGTLPPVPGRLSFARALPCSFLRPLLHRLLPPLLPLLGFALVTGQVAGHGPLLSADLRIRAAAAALRATDTGARLDPLFEFLADLGGAAVAGPVLAATALYATRWHRRRGSGRWWLPLAVAAVSGAAVPALVVPLKVAIGRTGLDGRPLGAGQLGLYPSGHAATAAVCFGTAALLMPVARRASAAVALALSAAVGTALVWCGYHWALDVAGSWCLAGVVLVVLARITDGAAAHGAAGARPPHERRPGAGG